jgi:hypothetical protein
LTKRLDAAWSVGTNQGGLDTGSIANTTYHIWLIKRSDTKVVDALFSTSATSPTMPTGYDYKRRVGSIIRTGSAIKGFVQDGDKFSWMVPVQDVSAANPGTSAVTRTLTVPSGIRVEANLTLDGYGSSSANMPRGIFLSDPSITDTTVTDACFTVYINTSSAIDLALGVTARIMTNTSAQIRSRLQQSGAGTNLIIVTHGWTDTRGK